MWDNNAWVYFYDNTTEGEPPYLIQDFVHALQPDARFIVMLRDPVERWERSLFHLLPLHICTENAGSDADTVPTRTPPLCLYHSCLHCTHTGRYFPCLLETKELSEMCWLFTQSGCQISFIMTPLSEVWQLNAKLGVLYALFHLRERLNLGNCCSCCTFEMFHWNCISYVTPSIFAVLLNYSLILCRILFKHLISYIF